MRARDTTFGGFDHTLFAEAFRGPGNDTRQWISYGTVDDKTEDEEGSEDPVTFDEDYGPLVNVTLQPSNVQVRCRVSSFVAGNGEGEYHPFIPGDEVLVAIPEGSEAAGCVIIGRLNNSIDKFPMESVGGQDPTKNTFGFTRRRTAFVQEFASTWMVRVASHGGFFLIADTGAITLRDGCGGALQMGPDIFGYSEPATALGADGHELSKPGDTASGASNALFQLDLTGRRFSLQMDDALFVLNSSSADNTAGEGVIAVGSRFTVRTGTNFAAEHVATTEMVFAALEQLVLALQTAGCFAAAAAPALTAFATLISTNAITLASATTLAPALQTGLQVAAVTPKPPATFQVAPTLGATLFLVG